MNRALLPQRLGQMDYSPRPTASRDNLASSRGRLRRSGTARCAHCVRSSDIRTCIPFREGGSGALLCTASIKRSTLWACPPCGAQKQPGQPGPRVRARRLQEATALLTKMCCYLRFNFCAGTFFSSEKKDFFCRQMHLSLLFPLRCFCLTALCVQIVAARSGPRFAPHWFLLLAGYENLTAPNAIMQS
jgi:hypothetical protein